MATIANLAALILEICKVPIVQKYNESSLYSHKIKTNTAEKSEPFLPITLFEVCCVRLEFFVYVVY